MLPRMILPTTYAAALLLTHSLHDLLGFVGEHFQTDQELAF